MKIWETVNKWKKMQISHENHKKICMRFPEEKKTDKKCESKKKKSGKMGEDAQRNFQKKKNSKAVY